MFRPSYSVRLMTPAFVNPLAAVSVADPAHGSPNTVSVWPAATLPLRLVLP
ncbi:MAG: hypothetical protein HYU51_01095 [Candidatus Rokubacteria bacterium]|nr:hypothetical protein [Candidatus Rokubacteria bacterium]